MGSTEQNLAEADNLALSTGLSVVEERSLFFRT